MYIPGQCLILCSPVVYEAMEGYTPISEDEVGFRAQDRIIVIAKSMDGWWKIRSVPSYITVVKCLFLRTL